MYPSLVRKLIEKFQVLPSVGPKTAEQYAFALKKLSQKDITELAQAIEGLGTLTRCRLCQTLTDQGEFCNICGDTDRKREILMVMEHEPDMESIEKTKRYPGLYFLLGELNEVATKNLITRIRHAKPPIKELILAFDVTPQMELFLFEIKQALVKAELNVNISRLGRGLPTGADLRYADTQTIVGALQHREQL